MITLPTGLRRIFLFSIVFTFLSTATLAGDWPTWRHDMQRSSATAESLSNDLHLLWGRKLPQQKPAWPEDPRLFFDDYYRPVVMGKMMFISSTTNDSVTAYNTDSGKQLWRFYAEGPVRFAPICDNGRIFFGADDGYFYCLHAKDGTIVWKNFTAPNNRKVLGNARLISVWPNRGGAVLVEGKLHFTIGVWPFEGTFLVTLDAATGKLAETEFVSTSGNQHTLEPIKTLKDKTPQGYIAANSTKLFIPGGRDLLAVYDRNTGKEYRYRYSSRGTTTVNVSVNENWFIHGRVNFNHHDNKQMDFGAVNPVITEKVAYFGRSGKIVSVDLVNKKVVETRDRKGKIQKKKIVPMLWQFDTSPLFAKAKIKRSKKQHAAFSKRNPVKVHLKAGNVLYCSQGKQLFALHLSADNKPGKIVWKAKIEETPATMLVADGKLFVVTKEQTIRCYGRKVAAPVQYTKVFATPEIQHDRFEKLAEQIVQHPDAQSGYCLVMGIGTGRLIEELARRTQLHIVGIDPDAEKISKVRQIFEGGNDYGTRVSLFHGNPLEFGLPPYFANVITSEDPSVFDAAGSQKMLKAMFHSLRPYGGKAFVPLKGKKFAELSSAFAGLNLPSAKIQQAGDYAVVERVGKLPSSADWTHEYGDSANTLTSKDELVKAPLGVLWYGGPASQGDLFYNRHFWGPSMTVIEGRMFIQGPSKLTAIDVYTGRILWKIALKESKGNISGRRGNDFERGVLAGFHFLAVSDGIYLSDHQHCYRFDPATGKKLSSFELDSPEDRWGRIRVQGDFLVAPVFRKKKDAKDIKEAVPVAVIVKNRFTGKTVWQKNAEMSFPLIAVSNDKIYCFDGYLENLSSVWRRKGRLPKGSDIKYLVSYDLKTGKQNWKYTTDRIATWLGYSDKKDVLLVSNQKGMTAYRGKDGSELWKKYAEGKGFKGHPENLWDKVILMGDRVLDQRGPGKSYDILTGDPVLHKNPLTGEDIPWEFTKSGHHCNYAIASPHLMTFRAASAGYCDLASSNTSRLDGFRSGCRNSLIPADGVLNAPNFAHGCSCGYSVFTSLALTYLPETEMWSYSTIKVKKDETIRRVGINFGAPGDRVSETGTLWLDYPNVGGSSPAVKVKVSPKPRYYKLHSAFLHKGKLNWVASSAVEGAKSIRITLSQAKKKTKAKYTVRLVFAEPNSGSGNRIFDVAIQGKTVLEKFEIAQAAGKLKKTTIKEFQGITAEGEIIIDLKSVSGQTLLSGVEILQEK